MFPVDALLFGLTLVAAIGCGLLAGFFFAFSACVMNALARIPASSGIAAMHSINVAVINPLFMTAFLGTALVCVVAMIVSLLQWSDSGAAYTFAGGALYMVGTFLVTMNFNVPRNNALASIEPDDHDAANAWARYVAGWTAWNHVRTAAALAAAVLLTIALR